MISESLIKENLKIKAKELRLKNEDEIEENQKIKTNELRLKIELEQ